MRRRLTRWGKWAGLGITVLVTALLITSVWWNVTYSGPTTSVGVMGGCLRVACYGPPLGRSPAEWRAVRARPYLKWRGSWQPADPSAAKPISRLFVPLWPASVLGAVITVLLWRSGTRGGARPCARCGYDLTGLARRTACPECGATGARP